MTQPRSTSAWPQVVCFLVLWLGLLWVGREKMLRDPGTFWHTVAGERMLRTGEVIRTDPFSFTHAGEPWIAQQWLGECIMAAVHRVTGLDGLLVLSAGILAATFAFLFGRFLRSGMPAPVAAVLLMLTIGASSYHFLARPHLATIALMAAVFALLCDVEAGRASPLHLLALPPAFVLWVNLHGGALGGIGMTLIVLLAWLGRSNQLSALSFQPSAFKKPSTVVSRCAIIGVVAALSGVAILINPYGPSLPRVWISLMRSEVLPRLIVEHAPLRPASIEGAMTLALGGVYVLALAVAVTRTRRSGALLCPIVWFVPLLWLVMAISRVRHGPIFAVTAAAAIAEMWRSCQPLAVGHQFKRKELALPVFATLATLGALTLQSLGVRCPLIGAGWARIDADHWPVKAVETLERRIAESSPGDGSARVFNDVRYGGFLIYHLPRAKVYIDDRCELYRDFALLRYAEIQGQPELIEGLALCDEIDFALVRTGGRLQRHLAQASTWRELYADATACTYERINQTAHTTSELSSSR